MAATYFCTCSGPLPQPDTCPVHSAHRPAHTPGPWFCDTDGSYPLPVEDGNGIWICQIGDSCGRCTDDPDEAEANARLIAAAPRLLTALAELIEVAEEAWPDRPIVKAAKQVISDAIGK